MIRGRNRYTAKSMIDLATVFISASWIGIWLLWFSVNDSYMYSADVTDCRLVYIDTCSDGVNSYKNPAFAFPSLSSDILTENLKVEDNVPARVVEHAKILERTRQKDVGPDLCMSTLKNPEQNSLATQNYRVKWPRINQVDKTEYITLRPLHIEESSELNKYGYYIPSYALDEVMTSESTWEIKAYVELNGLGQTEQVFLLAPTTDKGINSRVERMLYHGILSATGTKCSGRVVVSFRGEK